MRFLGGGVGHQTTRQCGTDTGYMDVDSEIEEDFVLNNNAEEDDDDDDSETEEELYGEDSDLDEDDECLWFIGGEDESLHDGEPKENYDDL